MPAQEKPATPAQAEASKENGKLGGRPPGSVAQSTILKREMRARLQERAHAIQDKLFDAAEDLALGMYVEAEIRDPITNAVIGTRTYKTRPNPTALAYLLDQTIDKATQNLNIDATVRPDRPLTDEEKLAIAASLEYANQPLPDGPPADEPDGDAADAGTTEQAPDADGAGAAGASSAEGTGAQ